MFGYDRPYAHPVSSFEVPVVPPDAEPDEGSQVSVCFNEAWLPYVLGALYQLYLQTTWKADSEGILLAQQRATKLTSLFVTPTCETGGVPAPYWDDESDVDDEKPPLEQIWYGTWVDGEFVESVGTIAIAGFLALGATPAAAIAFLTVAPRFRLAWRTGDWGGVIRIFFNEVDMGTVDTNTALEGVYERDFVGDESGETRIVQVLESVPLSAFSVGDPIAPMQVVRKKLEASQVSPPTVRYDPDCECVQTWNGSEWVNDPSADPRNNTALIAAPNTLPDVVCAAAGGVVAYIRQAVDAAVELSTNLGLGNALLSIIPLLLPIAPIVELVLLVAGAVLAFGTVVIQNAFEEENYAVILCAFFCVMDADGRVSSDGIEAAIAEIAADNAVTGAVVSLLLQPLGVVGTDNAGARLADGDADCGDCACLKCVEMFWALNDDLYGFSVVFGSLVAGDGIVGADVSSNSRSLAYIEAYLTGNRHFRSIELTYSRGFSSGANARAGFQLYTDGGTTQVLNWTAGVDGTHQTYSWDGDIEADYINFQGNSGTSASPMKLESARVYYTGDDITEFGVPCE